MKIKTVILCSNFHLKRAFQKYSCFIWNNSIIEFVFPHFRVMPWEIIEQQTELIHRCISIRWKIYLLWLKFLSLSLTEITHQNQKIISGSLWEPKSVFIVNIVYIINVGFWKSIGIEIQLFCTINFIWTDVVVENLEQQTSEKKNQITFKP